MVEIFFSISHADFISSETIIVIQPYLQNNTIWNLAISPHECIWWSPTSKQTIPCSYQVVVVYSLFYTVERSYFWRYYLHTSQIMALHVYMFIIIFFHLEK